jgi:hypothetical protein
MQKLSSCARSSAKSCLSINPHAGLGRTWGLVLIGLLCQWPAHAAMQGQRWTPGLGDNTPIGWFTVGIYAICFSLSALLAKRELREGEFGRFWLVLAVLLLLLGVNKQLDLQSWLTQFGRDLALSQGWYGQRQGVQIVFIVIMMLGGVLALLWGSWRWRDLWQMHSWACVGLVLLGVFVLVRAASFHHVDALLHLRLGPISGNGLMENGALALILVEGVRTWFFPRDFVDAQEAGAPLKV